MYRSHESRMNDFYKKKRKGYHKSTLERYRDYESDKKISVNREEPDIEEVDENENRREE